MPWDASPPGWKESQGLAVSTAGHRGFWYHSVKRVCGFLVSCMNVFIGVITVCSWGGCKVK